MLIPLHNVESFSCQLEEDTVVGTVRVICPTSTEDVSVEEKLITSIDVEEWRVQMTGLVAL